MYVQRYQWKFIRWEKVNQLHTTSLLRIFLLLYRIYLNKHTALVYQSKDDINLHILHILKFSFPYLCCYKYFQSSSFIISAFQILFYILFFSIYWFFKLFLRSPSFNPQGFSFTVAGSGVEGFTDGRANVSSFFKPRYDI